MQELRQTAGRLCQRGLAEACYASIISTIEIQLSLSPHQTAMPRHEVWASQSSHTTPQPSALIPSVISHNYIIINPILQKFISYHLYNALIARNRLNPKHLTINLQCPISIVCQHSLSKHLSKLYAFLIEAVDIP